MIYGQKGYDILDTRESEKMRASYRLMNKLEKGKQSGEERGWLTLEEIEERLGAAKHKEYGHGANLPCSALL